MSITFFELIAADLTPTFIKPIFDHIVSEFSHINRYGKSIATHKDEFFLLLSFIYERYSLKTTSATSSTAFFRLRYNAIDPNRFIFDRTPLTSFQRYWILFVTVFVPYFLSKLESYYLTLTSEHTSDGFENLDVLPEVPTHTFVGYNRCWTTTLRRRYRRIQRDMIRKLFYDHRHLLYALYRRDRLRLGSQQQHQQHQHNSALARFYHRRYSLLRYLQHMPTHSCCVTHGHYLNSGSSLHSRQHQTPFHTDSSMHSVNKNHPLPISPIVSSAFTPGVVSGDFPSHKRATRPSLDAPIDYVPHRALITTRVAPSATDTGEPPRRKRLNIRYRQYPRHFTKKSANGPGDGDALLRAEMTAVLQQLSRRTKRRHGSIKKRQPKPKHNRVSRLHTGTAHTEEGFLGTTTATPATATGPRSVRRSSAKRSKQSSQAARLVGVSRQHQQQQQRRHGGESHEQSNPDSSLHGTNMPDMQHPEEQADSNSFSSPENHVEPSPAALQSLRSLFRTYRSSSYMARDGSRPKPWMGRRGQRMPQPTLSTAMHPPPPKAKTPLHNLTSRDETIADDSDAKKRQERGDSPPLSSLPPTTSQSPPIPSQKRPLERTHRTQQPRKGRDDDDERKLTPSTEQDRQPVAHNSTTSRFSHQDDTMASHVGDIIHTHGSFLSSLWNTTCQVVFPTHSPTTSTLSLGTAFSNIGASYRSLLSHLATHVTTIQRYLRCNRHAITMELKYLYVKCYPLLHALRYIIRFILQLRFLLGSTTWSLLLRLANLEIVRAFPAEEEQYAQYKLGHQQQLLPSPQRQQAQQQQQGSPQHSPITRIQALYRDPSAVMHPDRSTPLLDLVRSIAAMGNGTVPLTTSIGHILLGTIRTGQWGWTSMLDFMGRWSRTVIILAFLAESVSRLYADQQQRVVDEMLEMDSRLDQTTSKVTPTAPKPFVAVGTTHEAQIARQRLQNKAQQQQQQPSGQSVQNTLDDNSSETHPHPPSRDVSSDTGIQGTKEVKDTDGSPSHTTASAITPAPASDGVTDNEVTMHPHMHSSLSLTTFRHQQQQQRQQVSAGLTSRDGQLHTHHSEDVDGANSSDNDEDSESSDDETDDNDHGDGLGAMSTISRFRPKQRKQRRWKKIQDAARTRITSIRHPTVPESRNDHPIQSQEPDGRTTQPPNPQQAKELQLPPRDQQVPLPHNALFCPLCVKPIKSTAAVSTGYVFCYRCIQHYVKEYQQCPITHVPLTLDSIRSIWINK